MHAALLELAIDEAVAGVQAHAGGPFGAVVACEGRVIARAHNCVTSSLDATAHAEIVAIRAACASLGRYELSGCELYASCEPCPMCLGASLWARLDRVFYAASRLDAANAGFDDASFYERLGLGSSGRAGPQLPVEAAPHPRALEPFAAWSALADKRPY